MRYRVSTEVRACAPHLDGTVYILEDQEAASGVEIWPGLGFNAIRWVVQHRDQQGDLLWSDPLLFTDPKPTRSGIPILVPFPNRVRGGRYQWKGKHYQLPLNDPAGKNAIHGFACYRPWRVQASGSGEEGAWLTGVFQGSLDAPECQALWPSDYLVQATYRLRDHGLALEMTVTNTGAEELPFGIGLHPYFAAPVDGARITLAADPKRVTRWVLQECLPTGERAPLDGQYLLLSGSSEGRTLDGLYWDDAFRLAGGRKETQSMVKLEQPSTGLSLVTRCSEDFRDWVVFTPPHRQAVCLEPYTCITDAVNLQAHGVDTGLKALAPGERWSGWVQWEAREIA